LVVGASAEDPTSVSNGGAAYVFNFSGSTWTEANNKLIADDVETDDGFGASVAIESRDVFVGAPSEDASGTSDAGAAYIFNPNSSYSTTPYYITTTDSSQINTSTYSQISGISFTQTTPENTSLKYLTSFDDRTTWKYWNGSSWTTTTLDDLQTNGNSNTELEALTETNWSSTGGFGAGTTTTLDFAVDLSTTDDSVTPELDQIEVSYEYYPISTDTIDFTTEGNYIQEDSDYTDVLDGKAILYEEFVCETSTVQDADLNSYSTVQIGDQCWMGENLRVGTKINSGDQTDNSVLEKYCYDNSDANCETYGGLYQWGEAVQYSSSEGVQGICPTGWHIPTDLDLYTLENEFASGSCDATRNEVWDCSPAGTELQSGGSSNFNAELGGYRDPGGTFSMKNSRAYFWHSGQSESSYIYRYLDSAQTGVYRRLSSIDYGFSIRCLKDGLPRSGYPTSPSYITTADSTQINTSTYQNISGISFTQTLPTNTNLKYLVSFDGRTTWKYWDGSSWTTSSLDDLQTNGNSNTELEALDSDDWAATGGFGAGTTTTLDFAIDLSTTDDSVTPELDQISVSYLMGGNQSQTDFETEGDYIQENSSYTDITGGEITLTGPTYPTIPYYVTTSDTSQQNTTGWTDINGVLITQDTPTGTDLKYLVSFDGRTTWKYWDGDSWEEASTLTGYGTDQTTSGTATALGPSYSDPSNAFDEETSYAYGNAWMVINPVSLPNWIQYQFTEPKQIQKLNLWAHNVAGWDPPNNFDIKASNTGEFSGEEVTIYSGTHPENTDAFVGYEFSNENSYSYYRIVVNSLHVEDMPLVWRAARPVE
jgi:uncharacterized protein (TIGR02145 family)